jgi:hypothetical protein
VAGPAPVSETAVATSALGERYRRVALPLVAVAPRTAGLTTLVRGSTTMYTDAAVETFAAAVVLWVDGRPAWETEARGLDYFHPAELRLPATGAGEPGLLEVFITREAYVTGAERPRAPGYEESWVFLVGGPAPGDTAVSVPSVPYLGSRKKGIDHKYQCFAGLRLATGQWRSTAYVINPYPEPLDLRGWLQAPSGAAEEVLSAPVPGRSVRALDLLDLAAAGGDPARFDYGTLIVWGSLKPQGYVAIQSPDGRTRAMDHFNPFWS